MWEFVKLIKVLEIGDIHIFAVYVLWKVTGLIPTGFKDVAIPFELLLELTRFLKMVSRRFF